MDYIKQVITQDPNTLDKKQLAEWKRNNLIDFFATVVANSEIVYKALEEKGVKCNFYLPTECKVLQDDNTKSIIFDMVDKDGRTDQARIIPAVARIPRGEPIKVYKQM